MRHYDNEEISAKRHPLIRSQVEHLHKANEGFAALAEQAKQIADRMFGQVPEPVNESKPSSPDGSVHELTAAISNLEHHRQKLGSQLQRLADL